MAVKETIGLRPQRQTLPRKRTLRVLVASFGFTTKRNCVGSKDNWTNRVEASVLAQHSKAEEVKAYPSMKQDVSVTVPGSSLAL